MLLLSILLNSHERNNIPNTHSELFAQIGLDFPLNEYRDLENGRQTVWASDSLIKVIIERFAKPVITKI